MGEKALWPAVAAVGLLVAGITVILVSRTDVLSVVLVFSVLGNIMGGLISLMVYGKVQKVEANTNGTMSKQQDLVAQLVDYLKNSAPVEKL